MGYYAHLLERNGNLKEALEQYQFATELNPNVWRDSYAGALNKSGQPDRAAAELEQSYLSQGRRRSQQNSNVSILSLATRRHRSPLDELFCFTRLRNSSNKA